MQLFFAADAIVVEPAKILVLLLFRFLRKLPNHVSISSLVFSEFKPVAAPTEKPLRGRNKQPEAVTAHVLSTPISKKLTDTVTSYNPIGNQLAFEVGNATGRYGNFLHCHCHTRVIPASSHASHCLGKTLISCATLAATPVLLTHV